MLKWLGKGLGLGPGKGSTRDGDADPGFTAALQAMLAPIAKRSAADRALSEALVRFVLAGDDPGVLAGLGSHTTLASELGLVHMRQDETRSRRDALYSAFGRVPVAVRRRWASVLEAATPSRQMHYTLVFPNNLHWPEQLVLHAAGMGVNTYGGHGVGSALTLASIEPMFEAEGLPADTLLQVAWNTAGQNAWGHGYRSALVAALPDHGEAVRRHADALRPLLAGKAEQRLHALKMMAAVPAEVFVAFAAEFADMALAGSRQVRTTVQPFLDRCAAGARPVLEAAAKSGKPEARLLALRQLQAIARRDGDAALEASARETAAADRADSVRALVGEWDGEQAAIAAEAPQRVAVERPVPSWDEPPDARVLAAVDALWRSVDEAIEKANRWQHEHDERMKAAGQKGWRTPTPIRPVTAAERDGLRALLASPEPPPRESGGVSGRRHHRQMLDALPAFAVAPGVGIATLLRVLQWFGLGVQGREGLGRWAVEALNAHHAARGEPSLLELACRLDAMGHDGAALVLGSWCDGWSPLARRWPVEAVQPFFVHHADALQALLTNTQDRPYSFDRMAPYAAVALLPAPPARLVGTLFDIALGSQKTDRAAAQDALARLDGKEARIIAALADGKGEVRAIAAQWLGRLRHTPAVPALAAAVAREKQDVAKGAMLDALQALGQPVEKYLGRDALPAEAAKALAKGLPRDLDYFPWDGMPPVRWNDTGAPVDPVVLRWLLVQAVKQKTPEPNAVLRKYCAMFAPRDREAFGQAVLETWLAEDVRPVPVEQASAAARQNAQSTFRMIQQYPQYHVDSPFKDKSEDELFAYYLPGCLRQPAGSAISTKGLLAVVAACAGERAAPPVARYLKEWYGTRAAQGKALIAMLAWIEHPAATQLMLSIGHRFRTKGFQDEATRQAEALAERKGWTMAELADRTVPTAGFDENGEMELSYGERRFVARLLPDFRIELFNPDGRKIASLPEPRQDDDAEAAANAKKDFASAKKQLKGIVDLQTDRLYEALCTGRDWAAEDWSRYLLQHPVLRHLVQRLVWIATVEGRPPMLFRPLADGTFTDDDDNPVELPADARISLAHDSKIAPEQAAAWQRHLQDYEIKPLFQQFGKGGYRLPAGSARETAIKDFEGHLIEAFALRGRALKLDWTRGPTEDGGWFMTYQKRFPTLGLVAEIEFTGNPLPETNRTVALVSLSFASAQAGPGSGRRALADVPAVLLSECYDDLRVIAGDGSGFDPDWQKKSEY